MKMYNVEQKSDLCRVTPGIKDEDDVLFDNLPTVLEMIELHLAELEVRDRSGRAFEARVYLDGRFHSFYNSFAWSSEPDYGKATDWMEIGTCPGDEWCEQVGKYYREDIAKFECEQLIKQLTRMHGEPPPNTSLYMTRNSGYWEVHVGFTYYWYDSVQYALTCEGNFPETWDRQAKQALAKYNKWERFIFSSNVVWGGCNKPEEWFRMLHTLEDNGYEHPYAARRVPQVDDSAMKIKDHTPRFTFYSEGTGETLLEFFIANNMRLTSAEGR